MSFGKAVGGWLRRSSSSVTSGGELSYRSASRSHVGRVRVVNEDRLLDDPDHGLWAVADGMGGHAAGDVAAEAAVAALRAVADAGSIGADAIEDALQTVNGDLRRWTREGASMSGATVAAISAIDGGMTILWAGDCRVYRMRNGRLQQLTRDHSVVQEMVDAGALDALQAIRHPQAHVVTRALGAGDELLLERLSTDAFKGDIYLLCSDGLAIPFVTLQDVLSRNCERLEDVATMLLDAALLMDGRDNISLILIERS